MWYNKGKWNIWFFLASYFRIFEIDHRVIRVTYGFSSQFTILYIVSEQCYVNSPTVYHYNLFWFVSHSFFFFVVGLLRAQPITHWRVRHSSFGEWKRFEAGRLCRNHLIVTLVSWTYSWIILMIAYMSLWVVVGRAFEYVWVCGTRHLVLLMIAEIFCTHISHLLDFLWPHSSGWNRAAILGK